MDKTNKIEGSAFFKLSYGLYLLTAKVGEKDNACIINTAIQVTDTPKRILFAINKDNYTCEMIEKSGIFNVSVLSVKADFSVYERFGFSSGKQADKFQGFDSVSRSENGLYYLTDKSNAYISGKVISKTDCGTHIVFVADVTEAKTLNDEESVTYQYYFDHVKPKKQTENTKTKGYICKICGYFHEGETLPPDFICPICKHGAEDFEPVGF